MRSILSSGLVSHIILIDYEFAFPLGLGNVGNSDWRGIGFSYLLLHTILRVINGKLFIIYIPFL